MNYITCRLEVSDLAVNKWEKWGQPLLNTLAPFLTKHLPKLHLTRKKVSRIC